MKKKTNKSGSGTVQLAVLGASIAGLAAAYFFLGPKGQKNQKQAKAWAIKMKGDVVEKLETAREISEPVYHEIIDSVATEYANNKRASREEVKALAQDLKKHWRTISGGVRAVKKMVVKGARKAAKKARQ